MCWYRCEICRGRARPCSAATIGYCRAARAPTRHWREAALELLKRDGVDLGLVRRVARPTGCAAIMVGAAGENLIAVAPGANAEVVASAVPDAMLGPGSVVVCQMEVP